MLVIKMLVINIKPYHVRLTYVKNTEEKKLSKNETFTVNQWQLAFCLLLMSILQSTFHKEQNHVFNK